MASSSESLNPRDFIPSAFGPYNSEGTITELVENYYAEKENAIPAIIGRMQVITDTFNFVTAVLVASIAITIFAAASVSIPFFIGGLVFSAAGFAIRNSLGQSIIEYQIANQISLQLSDNQERRPLIGGDPVFVLFRQHVKVAS